MKKITKDEETKLITMFERWWALLPKGGGAKVGKGAAREAWIKKFKNVEKENWDQFNDVIVEASSSQDAYRKRILKQYPDEFSRKQAGVFLPSRPHPATWINQERWHDEVPEIQSFTEKVEGGKRGCSMCPKESAVLVSDVAYCAWCWEKKFAPNALDRLREKAKELGLVKREGETIEDVADRAREILKSKSSVWANHFR